MKKVLITFIIIAGYISAHSQSIQGTERVKIVDGDTLWSPTLSQVKTYVGSPSPGTANQLVATNDAGTALENVTLSTGTSGTNFNIDQTGAGIVLNIPDASGSNRGLVTTGGQTFAGLKTFSSGSTHTGQAAVAALQVNGVTKQRYDLLSGTTTLSGLHSNVAISAGTAYTITLPAVATAGEWVYNFTIVSGTSLITIDPAGAETFVDGSAAKFIQGVGTTLRIQSNGVTWTIFQ